MLKPIAAVTILMATLAATGAQAQVGADLNISPRRVTFDEKGRSASVYVFNQGDAPATYTVELADRVMQTNGQIVPAADAPGGAKPNSALEYVQYTPRRVTLQPKESQVIRVRVTPPAKGVAGEYRSHLVVTALPPETTGFTAAQAAQTADGQVSMQIVALFSVSIPVIIREGQIDARASVDSIKRLPAAEGAPNGSVQLDLVRLGANSVYGDLEIYAGKGPAEQLVGAVRGVAVYPEIARRTVTAPLAKPVAAGEPLRIVYKDDDARKGATLAAATGP